MTDIDMVTILICIYVAAVFTGSLAYLRVRRENERLRDYVDELMQELRVREREDHRRSEHVRQARENSADES